MDRTHERIYDEWLVVRSRDGDREAFAELVARWQGSLLGHAMQLTGRRDVALDVVQETWLALIRQLHRIEDPARFAGYAHRILARRCADQARRGQRRRAVAAELAVGLADRSSLPEAPARSDVERMRAALDGLPTERRTLIALHYLHELPLPDIARLLGVPLGTVKSRLHAARAALRRALSERRQPCPNSKT